MSISQLTGYIGSLNIAEEVDERLLTDLGKRVKRQYDEDCDSMSDWVEMVENGIRLMKQEWEPKSTPWQGASNYKDPILTEASVKFGDRATLELLRSSELVGCEVIGRDPEGQKETLADRVSEAMNYQVNHDMRGWRDDQESLFYSLPNYGSVFKKVTYDPLEEKCESTVICYPDFAVNQATKSMDECRSFSHILDFSKNEVEERIQSGAWLEYRPDDDERAGDYGSNEQQDVEHSIENEEKFIEQQCFYDLDEDGYEEPYIVTIHHKTCKVVRIVARFDERSIIVRYNDKIMPLDEAKQREQQQKIQRMGGQGLMRLIGMKDPEARDDDFELLKIEPFQNVCKYGFIPAPDGTFLNLGYSHLLGAMVEAINTNTNQLTDAGTLQNVSGGFLSKEFRKTLGLDRLRPGEWKKTDVPAEKLASGIFPKPAQEPSSTLYQLGNDKLERAQSYMAILDVSGQMNSQTAPTTALAMIQEAAIPTTALFSRILRSTSREFQILFRINQRTFPVDKYQQILDDPQANPQQDFNSEMLDIVPTASAERSSKTQRIQTASIEMEQFDRVLQAGGNPVPIVRNFFEAIDSELIDQVFPEEGSMSPQERKQVEELQKAQQLENQIKQQQLEILTREQNRLDAETQADLRKTMAEIEEIRVGLDKTKAEIVKTMEEAESEQVKNQIDAYTSQFNAVTDRLKVMADFEGKSQEIQSRTMNVNR